MTVYLVGVVDITDPDTYAQYEAGGYESVTKHGVEPLAVTDSPEAIEGTLPGQRVVLLRFKDREHLDRWYKSPEYQRVKPLRLKASETKLLVAIEALE
jgi:uncharacterized protein (DUF1330 family)